MRIFENQYVLSLRRRSPHSRLTFLNAKDFMLCQSKIFTLVLMQLYSRPLYIYLHPFISKTPTYLPISSLYLYLRPSLFSFSMAEKYSPLIPTCLIAIVIMSRLISTVGYKLRDDPEAIRLASTDYGHILRENPAAVLYPSSINDISSLIKFANNVSVPFGVAAKGQGHSTRGQAMARNGIVVEMSSLRNHRRQHGSGIQVLSSTNNNDVTFYYADVGGEQLWVDVLHATLEHGLSPVSWTDYLYLTVGGTLSNAGISGQTFRFGPQISNIYEMDVVTGMHDLSV